jgi:hypothetical protein
MRDKRFYRTGGWAEVSRQADGQIVFRKRIGGECDRR